MSVLNIGIPKEIKTNETRVGLLPEHIQILTDQGISTLVETQAGINIGIDDQAYEQAGATIVADAAELYHQAQLIVKVKEPLAEEVAKLRSDHIIFCYLHLAASRTLTEGLINSQCTALAYEMVSGPNQTWPCLAPMSAIAGKIATMQAALYLTHPHGPQARLMGDITGAPNANIHVIGAGIAGVNAARLAHGMGANVHIHDIDEHKISLLQQKHPQITGHTIPRNQTLSHLKEAHAIISAVLLPGESAPKILHHQDLASLQPGCVLIDISIDQGGSFETSKPTTHQQPTYVIDGIIHYAVTNMPAAAGLTATHALTHVTFPYIQQIALSPEMIHQEPALKSALSISQKHIHFKPLAEKWQLPYQPL